MTEQAGSCLNGHDYHIKHQTRICATGTGRSPPVPSGVSVRGWHKVSHHCVQQLSVFPCRRLSHQIAASGLAPHGHGAAGRQQGHSPGKSPQPLLPWVPAVPTAGYVWKGRPCGSSQGGPYGCTPLSCAEQGSRGAHLRTLMFLIFSSFRRSSVSKCVPGTSPNVGSRERRKKRGMVLHTGNPRTLRG